MKTPYSETGQIIVDSSYIETWGNLNTANLNILTFKNIDNNPHVTWILKVYTRKAMWQSLTLRLTQIGTQWLSPLFLSSLWLKNEDTNVL